MRHLTAIAAIPAASAAITDTQSEDITRAVTSLLIVLIAAGVEGLSRWWKNRKG